MINPDSASLAAHTSHGDSATSQNDPIFWPLTFRSGLTVKNRIFRSNISGQFDKYNGQGTQTRIDWETSFARGGVGCILSSYAPVHVRGRILVRYAMIDNDDKIPFWRQVGQSVAQAGKEAFPNHPTQSGDCKYIVQLSHSGRQQDVGGFENKDKKALSSTTSRPDYFHGILCRAMTKREILEVIKQFGDAAERAERAGLAGVELHAATIPMPYRFRIKRSSKPSFLPTFLFPCNVLLIVGVALASGYELLKHLSPGDIRCRLSKLVKTQQPCMIMSDVSSLLIASKQITLNSRHKKIL